MAALPPELTDTIVSHLSDDPRSLRACTLASRLLLPRAQYLAFRNLRLTGNGARKRLVHVLNANPGLAGHVQSISVHCLGTGRELEGLGKMVFGELNMLVVRMYRPDPHGDEEDQTIRSISTLISRTPTLDHLKLWDCVFDGPDLSALFASCAKSSVRRLSLVEHCVLPDAHISTSMEFEEMHLGNPPLPLVRAFCANPPGQLRVLSMAYDAQNGGVGVRALGEVLTGLECLRIEFGSRDAFQFGKLRSFSANSALRANAHSRILVRPPLLDLTALVSLRTLYLETILTEKRTRHEHWALLAPRLLANILLPPSAPNVVLHVHAAPLPAVHAWVHPVAPTTLLLEFHGAEAEEQDELEQGVRRWAARGVARKSKVELAWSPVRVPVYGLEERFMEICTVQA